MATNGSRGDVQPFVAFGKGLLQAGFAVRVWTNVNHVAFFEQEGLDAVGVNFDCDKVIREDPLAQKSMGEGDMATFFKWFAEINKKSFPETLRKKIDDFKSWQPDLVVSGSLESTEAGVLAAIHGIPVIAANFTLVFMASRKQPSVAKEPSWAPHLLFGTLVMHSGYASNRDGKKDEVLRQLPEGEPYMPNSFREFMFQAFHPITPVLVAASPSLASVREDFSKDLKKQMKITGAWVLSKEEQRERFEGSNALFGGPDRKALEAFLTGGDPPVYMGWGSMFAISPEHMTCMAVRSLKEAGLRGVVLKGTAKMGIEKLAGQPDSEALVEYAKESLLFVDTAPHEWLFPKCAVLVHHGGAGTFAAAVRSGVPSVITPCFLDQFDHARIVSEQGIGVGLPQFSSVKVGQLVKALKKCSEDSAIIQKARAMGEKVTSEDGVNEAVRVIDDFLVDEVSTGKWRLAFDEKNTNFQKLKSQAPPGCMGWFARMCCYAEPNEYDVV